MDFAKQTSHRNKLTAEAIDEFDTLAESVKLGICQNTIVVKKLTDLAVRLQTVKGKKVYGYLPSEVKKMVDDLVDEMEKDDIVKRLYDLWYKAKCAVENTYTDHFSPQLPLSQENVFKPIRNAVIKRAYELGKELAEEQELSDLDNVSDEPHADTSDGSEQPSTTDKDTSLNTGKPSNASSSSTGTANRPIRANGQVSAKIVTAVTRLGKDISNTFRRQFYDYANDPVIQIDSRLKREIEAKKRGQDISM